MNLAGRLLSLLAEPSGAVIALVGAGGKTSALFGLAGELAGGCPSGALMTTTTHLFDPRLEPGRPYDELVLDPSLGAPGGPEPWDPGPRPGPGRRVLLAARALPGEGKLQGVHPSRVAGLRRAWDYVLVEADGARRLPVKAPAEHEPVVPPGADLVLGLVGLACLGRPMDERTVHRPGLFAEATGCAPGEPIGPEHIAALTRSPLGLFKGAPAGAARVLVLNQADRCRTAPEALLKMLEARGPVAADLVLVCCLREPDPAARVLASAQTQ
jgi:probable selenium-dependent hydroxylase accessory protein YqeC